MPVAFSFSASFRWVPRYDWGDHGRILFAIPDGVIEYDPFFIIEPAAINFPTPSGEVADLLIEIGSIGTDSGSISFPTSTGDIVSVLKPLTPIVESGGSISFPTSTGDILDVLVTIDPFTENGTINFAHPTGDVAIP